MYKSGCILAVLRPNNGSYPERDGKVYLPRHSKFTVRVKNNNNVPVEVKLKIGGEYLFDGETFKVYPNECKDFKNLSAVLPEESSGDSGEEEINVIEAEFKKLDSLREIHHHHHHDYWYPRPYWPYWYEWPYRIYIGTSQPYGGSSSMGMAVCQSNSSSGSYPCSDSNVKSLANTMKGLAESKLKIETDQIELPDIEPSCIRLKLELVEADELPKERFCINCGNQRKTEDKYCPACGHKH